MEELGVKLSKINCPLKKEIELIAIFRRNCLAMQFLEKDKKHPRCFRNVNDTLKILQKSHSKSLHRAIRVTIVILDYFFRPFLLRTLVS